MYIFSVYFRIPILYTAYRFGDMEIDVDCPLCDDHKGKMNLNLQKNVFRCNRCGESGGMLNLYAKAYGVDIKTARKEIIEATGRTDFKREMLHRKDRDADYKCRHGK